MTRVLNGLLWRVKMIPKSDTFKDIYFKGIVFLWVPRFSKQKNICLECLHLKPMTFGILCGKMYVTPSVIYDNKTSRVLIQKFTKSIIYSFMTTLRAINNPFFWKVSYLLHSTLVLEIIRKEQKCWVKYRPNPLRDLVRGNEGFQFRQYKMYLFSWYRIILSFLENSLIYLCISSVFYLIFHYQFSHSTITARIFLWN